MSIDTENWGMLGHTWAVDLLRGHVAGGRLRHAYLITGLQGVGRRTLALRLAQALNCPQPVSPGEPCRTCRNCTQLERMQHPDLAVVQAESEGGTLKVEQVRELQRSLSLAPYQARYRVALLLRFEEAHPSAANALLKTLEEPPAQVVLILTAQSAEALLPTIVSRCEVLRLRPLSVETVSQSLKTRWGLPVEQANLLAHISGGRPGFAVRLNENPDWLDRRQTWLNEHWKLLSDDRVKRFAWAEKIAKDKDLLRQALRVWSSLWHDALLRIAGVSAPLINPDREGELATLISQLDLASTHRVVESLERTQDLLERNVNTRLAVEVLMLELPHIRK